MSFDLKKLTNLFGPEKVLSDPPAITAYAIDASIYKVTPKAIVLIEHQTDMESALRYARENQVPLTARSGGTNLTGNAVGEGLILEFSRLNRILEINEREQWARVQPGITYAELNRHLAPQGLMFAPDPSSGEMCKLGGMLGNNAAGAHSLKYGATKDNVLSMEVLLANGNWITAKTYRLDDPVFQKLLLDNPSLKNLLELIQNNRSLIQSKKRKVSKNSSGYNLFALADGLEAGHFPLHQLFIGSEGTLGLTQEAKIKLVPCPPETATALVYFKSLSDLGEATSNILRLSPSALEMMDAATLDLIGRAAHDIPLQAEAMLLIEFDELVREKMEALLASLEKTPLSAAPTLAFDPAKQAALWKVRKAVNPILYRYDAKKKPIHFVDDVVVPAERIPELIPYLEARFSERGVKVAIYGHIGDGNAHINPLLDLNDPDDFEKMTDLYREIHQVVIHRFEGSLCGEHGDGRVRAELLEGLYGPEVYALFKEVKRLFDPENLLNLGVKISDHSFTDQIDYERYTKPCATCGKCNAVCPVYDVVGEESNAARGWFHILTDPDYSYEKSARVVEACINCKSCRTVCPAGIDVSALILKKREAHPNKTAEALFAFQSRRVLFESFLKVAAWMQPFWNTRPVRLLIEYITLPWVKGLAPTARIPADMVLPRLAKRHLRERYSQLTDLTGSQSTTAYFHGCAANYIDDGVGDAVIDLLRKNGVTPALPPQRCSGTPIQTYGLIDRAREDARFNMDSMEGFKKIITGCASCTFMLKDYATIFPEGGYHLKAQRLAEKVVHISEFMADRPPENSEPRGNDQTKKRRVTYHSSCHLRAAGVNDAPRRLLRQDSNLEFVEMPDANRCAGGAGTFCIKNPKQSEKIFERKRRGIEVSGAELVVTSCPACMIQLKNGLKGGVDVKHIAQVLSEE